VPRDTDKRENEREGERERGGEKKKIDWRRVCVGEIEAER